MQTSFVNLYQERIEIMVKGEQVRSFFQNIVHLFYLLLLLHKLHFTYACNTLRLCIHPPPECSSSSTPPAPPPELYTKRTLSCLVSVCLYIQYNHNRVFFICSCRGYRINDHPRSPHPPVRVPTTIDSHSTEAVDSFFNVVCCCCCSCAIDGYLCLCMSIKRYNLSSLY